MIRRPPRSTLTDTLFPYTTLFRSFIWLGEQPSTFGVLGIISIVAGILLIASDGNLRRFTAPQSWTGIRWGLFIGMFIAAYTVTDAYSVKVLLIAPVILDWLSALGNAVILAPRAWVRRASMMQQKIGRAACRERVCQDV